MSINAPDAVLTGLAMVMLAITDVVLGRVSEADKVLDQGLALLPEDPVLHALNAVLAALAEDRQRAERSVDRARPYMSEAEASVLDETVNIVLDIRSAVQSVIDDGPNVGQAQIVILVARVTNVFNQLGEARDMDDSALIRLGSMMPPSFGPLFESAQTIVSAAAYMQPERALTNVEEVVAVAPGGHLMLLSAVVHDRAGQYERAIEEYRLARDLPSLFEIDCFCNAAIMTNQLYLAQRDIVAGHFLEARAKLAEMGLDQAVRDYLNTCDGTWMAQPSFVRQLSTILSPLGYADWVQQMVFNFVGPEPTHPDHLYARALASYYMGSYGPAYADVTLMLEQSPDDANAQKLQRDIKPRLGTVGRPPLRGDETKPTDG